jgi:formylglycine-generating enzyme required for sulfatase activity
VEVVDWYDCVKWCNARSQLAHLTPVYYTDAGLTQVYTNGDVNITNANVNWSANGYRLPTEAEWEKAARGGLSGQRFPWGDTISWSQANYPGGSGETYDLEANNPGFDPAFTNGVMPFTSPVGYFAANGYGLNDMAGNVAAWCWDSYAPPPYPTGSPYLGGADPRGPAEFGRHVFRGGDWDEYAGAERCAFRDFPAYPTGAFNIVGFRCVRGLPNTPTGMALILAGSFTIGDTLDGESDAIPTNVYVSAFYMDVNLVSSNQWAGVYSYATNHGYSFDNAGAGNAGNNPVQTVDWYDVVKWCNARSKQAGLVPVYYTNAAMTAVYTNGDVDAVYANWAVNGYRLPTEAEWEKAARGGLSGQRFPWGDTISESQANYDAFPNPPNSDGYTYDLGPYTGYNTNFDTGSQPYTSPVGYFAANGYGLNDMAGNVFEWCWDWYAGPTNPGSPYLGGTDPRGPVGPVGPLGLFRVSRGGAWGFYADNARCAGRDDVYPHSAASGYGFRCVRGL